MKRFLTCLLFLACLLSISDAQSQSLDSLQKSLAQAKYPEHKAELLKKIAWQYRHKNFRKSLDYAMQSLGLSQTTHNRKLEAEVTRMIGVIYLHFLFSSEGLEWTQKALLISEEIGYDEGVAFCYDSFGVNYYHQKVYHRAEEYFNNGLKIFQKLQHNEGLGYSYTHLCWVYRETNRIDQAVEAGKKSLEARGKLNDKRLYANTLRDLAQVYEKQGDIEKAFASMRESIHIVNNIEGKPFIDEHYQVIAHIFLKHKPDSALYYTNLAYKYAHERGDKRQKVLIYEIYQKIYENKKDFTKAYYYQNLHYQYKDSVYNENIEHNNASMEAKFEYAQKEKILIAEQKRKDAEAKLQIQQQQWIIYTILLFVAFLAILAYIFYRNWAEKKKLNEELDDKNQELATQSESLYENNIFKDKLFTIISHDLRAPLGQVKGVLDILQRGVLEQDEFQSILPTLQQNIKTTLDFLDNLLLWAKSQIQGQNIDKQYFQIDEVVQQNLRLFSQGALLKQIELKKTSEPHMVFADRNMIDLVLRNLVNNAIKYCEKNDTITVTCEEQNDILRIGVCDTGVGITKENIEKILGSKSFSLKGTLGEAGTGLGLKLCQDFIVKNDGCLWIESEVGKGSQFYFTVPLQARL